MKESKDKKSRILVIKLTQDEFDELERVCPHYGKSRYVREAVKNQIAVDRIRGVAGT